MGVTETYSIIWALLKHYIGVACSFLPAELFNVLFLLTDDEDDDDDEEEDDDDDDWDD